MSFNTILKNVSSNLYGVYNQGPIHYLLDIMNPNDSYGVQYRPDNNKYGYLDVTYRGEQTTDKLRKIIEIIGNNREMLYHDLPIKSILFDYVVDNKVVVIKNIKNLDVLLEYLISMLHILEGRAEQEDWDIHFIFTESAQDIYAKDGTLSEASSALSNGELPSLINFRFDFDVPPRQLEPLFNNDLMTSAPSTSEDFEYDLEDFERYDYARYGEPVLELDPMGYYVTKVEEKEQRKQANREYDIEQKMKGGLLNYCALPNYDKNIYHRGMRVLKAFFKPPTYIELYK